MSAKKSVNYSLRAWQSVLGVLAIGVVSLIGLNMVDQSSALTGDCGSGFTQLATGTVKNSSGSSGPGQVILYKYGNPISKYCAVLNHTGSAQGVYTNTSVTLLNGAGKSATDSGNFRYYAGPVTVAASTGCLKVSGSMTWSGSNYSYSQTSWCVSPPAPPPPPPPPPPAPAPAPAPAPSPTPKPAPAPAPKPSPSPSPSPRPSPSPGSPSPAPSPNPGAPAPIPSTDANAAAAVGTLAVQLTVPAGNASKMFVVYGTSPVSLDQTSEEVPVNGPDGVISLKGLKPASTYNYQIVRTNGDGVTATSPIATFVTRGFTVAIHFVDNKSQGVKDMAAELVELKLKETSDKNGIVYFDNVSGGQYNVAYTYNNKAQKQPINVDTTGVTVEDANQPDDATVSFFINVEKSSIVAPTPDKKSGGNSWIIWVVIALAIIIVFIIFRRFRRAPAGIAGDFDYGELEPSDVNHFPDLPQAVPPPGAPPFMPTVDNAPVVGADPTGEQIAEQDHPSKHHHRKHHKEEAVQLPQGPPPEHMGESLKEMVLRSMAEEAKKKRGG